MPTDTPRHLLNDLAVSFLRTGKDAVAARRAKALWSQADAPDWPYLVARQVWKRPHEQQRHAEDALIRAEITLRDSERLGYRLLSWREESYPAMLREIPDPPAVLWVNGDVELLQRAAVAVVGAREATPASLAFAKSLACDLVRAGLVVVSGLARGVDGAAHAGALEGEGPTVAVLGCGLARIYPPQHASLAARIATSGIVISELPPNALPFPHHFPLRNRIISGLSRGVVVVEAAEKSGSLSTARSALEQGRDVLAVPGGPLSGRYRGCHALIKDGARLVESVKDVLEELNWVRPAEDSPADSANHLQLSDLEANMARGEPYSVDDLAGATGRSVPELLADLSVLELAGRLKRTPAGQFIRLAGPEGAEGN